MHKFIRILFFSMLLFAVVALAGLTWLFGVRPGLETYQLHRHPDTHADTAGAGLSAAWFGTTALLLDDGQSALFIDPFFTRPGGWPQLMLNRPIAPDEALIAQWLHKAGVTRLDAVLVTHSHYDHAMDAGVVARLTGAVLVGSASTANIGRGAGLPESQIRIVTPGLPLRFGRFGVSLLESRHAGATGGRPTGAIEAPLVPPARYTDYRQGGTYGVHVEHALGNVLHHGSAGWQANMYRGRRADVVFLGIAGVPALEHYLAEVVDAAGATRVIPTHWDDFTRPLDAPLVPLPFGVDLEGFLTGFVRLRPQLRLLTLEPGQRVVLYPPP